MTDKPNPNLYVFPPEAERILLSNQVGTPVFLALFGSIFGNKGDYSQESEPQQIRNNVLTLWALCMDDNNNRPIAKLLKALSNNWPRRIPGEISPAEKGILLKRALVLWYEILPNLSKYIKGNPDSAVFNTIPEILLDVFELLRTDKDIVETVAGLINDSQETLANMRIMAGKLDILISTLKQNYALHRVEIDQGIPPQIEIQYLLGMGGS